MHLLSILIPGWRVDLDPRAILSLDRSSNVEPVDLDGWASVLSEGLTPAPKNCEPHDLRLVEPFGSATIRILLRCGLPGLPCTGVRRMRLALPSLDTGGTDARSRGVTPVRDAPAPASLRPAEPSMSRRSIGSTRLCVSSKNASDLTLPDLGPSRPSIRCHVPAANGTKEIPPWVRRRIDVSVRAFKRRIADPRGREY
jgi:hypothetical protein